MMVLLILHKSVDLDKCLVLTEISWLLLFITCLWNYRTLTNRRKQKDCVKSRIVLKTYLNVNILALILVSPLLVISHYQWRVDLREYQKKLNPYKESMYRDYQDYLNYYPDINRTTTMVNFSIFLSIVFVVLVYLRFKANDYVNELRLQLLTLMRTKTQSSNQESTSTSINMLD